MLFWWPIGVRKAQEAPTATAIRKLSGLTARRSAMPTEIGAMTTAVAALFMMSDSVMVTISTSVSSSAAGKPAAMSTSPLAISAVAPLASSAPPTGIIAPSSTMTGQSTDSYISRIGTICRTTIAATAVAKAAGRLTSPKLAAATAATNSAMATAPLRSRGTCRPRSASGRQPSDRVVDGSRSGSPSSSSTSPARKRNDRRRPR